MIAVRACFMASLETTRAGRVMAASEPMAWSWSTHQSSPRLTVISATQSVGVGEGPPVGVRLLFWVVGRLERVAFEFNMAQGTDGCFNGLGAGFEFVPAAVALEEGGKV